MRVFNVAKNVLDYRGRTIQPGMSVDIDIDFISDRDKSLVEGKFIAFDALPAWYLDQQPVATVAPPVVVPQVAAIPVPTVDTVDDKADVRFKKK